MAKHSQNYTDLYKDNRNSNPDKKSSKFKKGLACLVAGSILSVGAMAYNLVDEYQNHLMPSEEIASYVEEYDMSDRDKEVSKLLLDVVYSAKRDDNVYDNDVSYNLAINDMINLYDHNKSDLVNFINENLNNLGADFLGERDYFVSDDELDDFYDSMSDNSGYDRLIDFITENHAYIND